MLSIVGKTWNCVQMSFVKSASSGDVQPLVELVLEARAEVIVHVTDVDSVVIINFYWLQRLRTDSIEVSYSPPAVFWPEGRGVVVLSCWCVCPSVVL